MRPSLKTQPLQSIDPPDTTTQDTETTIPSIYDADFEQHLSKINIHPIWGSREPDLDNIYETLASPRASLALPQFSVNTFKTFQRASLQASDEDGELRDQMVFICRPGYVNLPRARNTLFNHFKPLTDGTIPSARPDISYGALSEEVHPAIRNELSGPIAPAPNAPIVANFFLEVKGPDGSAAVQTRQARYDGAIAARAAHRLQSYGQEPVYDGRPYAFSSTYLDGTLKLYAHHLTAPTTPGGQVEYHMTQISTYALTGNREVFVEGVAAFGNLRDLARQRREAVIREANLRYQGAPAGQEGDTGRLHDGKVRSKRSRNPQVSAPTSLGNTQRVGGDESGNSPGDVSPER